MNFWKNVDEELNYSGKTRKELAKEANFPDSYISKGIKRNSIPAADLALRISHALNISLDELLEFPKSQTESQNKQNNNITEQDIKFLKKNIEFIKIIENLSNEKKDFLKTIISELTKLH